MKAIKIIKNPYTVVITFLMIIISGQHLGGFYLVYLLLALPHGSIYSLLAVIGIVLLLIAYHKSIKPPVIAPAVNLAAVIMLIASICIFFYNDDEHYNYGTFYQVVPVVSLILFFLIALISIVTNLLVIYKISVQKRIHV